MLVSDGSLGIFLPVRKAELEVMGDQITRLWLTSGLYFERDRFRRHVLRCIRDLTKDAMLDRRIVGNIDSSSGGPREGATLSRDGFISSNQCLASILRQIARQVHHSQPHPSAINQWPVKVKMKIHTSLANGENSFVSTEMGKCMES